MASSRRIPGLSALLAAAAMLLLPLAVAAADQAVSISGFAFNPSSVTVNVGDTVTWTNSDTVAHTATDDGPTPEWNTGTISPGGSGSVIFNSAGTYGYHCTIHPTMQGTVVVQAASSGGGGGGGGGVPGTDTVPLAPSPDGGPLGALLVGAVAGGLIGLGLLRQRTGSGQR